MSKKSPQNFQALQTRHIQPLTKTQDSLITAIEKHPITVAIGPAGVGKTYIAVNVALNGLAANSRRKIVLSRSNMPTGRSLGAFPGDIKDKLEPWLQPMITEATDRMGQNTYDTQYRKGKIQYQPLETVRGASFNDTDILFDEAQNLTYEEVKAVTTRVGKNSRLVLMGDPMQSDIRSSGIMRFVDIMRRHNVNIPVIQFTTDDIVRSDIVKDIVIALMKEEAGDN